MKPNVYIARKIPAEVEAYIAKHCNYSKWDHPEPIPRATLLENLSIAEGLLTSGGKINQELLDHAPHLKVVSTISVGYNNFDLEAMKSRGILGTNTPQVLNDTVADLIFSLILSTARRIPEMDRYVKEGQWKRGDDENLFGLDVHHKKLGIIGMGGIGEAVAHRGKWGFGMEVLYHNRHRKPEVEATLEAKYCTMHDLLKESDFIVLMTPLTAETYQMIGAKEFALMKSTAVFVNASRGATVDEEAMIHALQQGKIYGAGLDVFEHEPLTGDSPLLSLPNVVTLPHIGSSTRQTRHQMAMLAAENLVSALKGETPNNLVKELRT
ncbi:2-hydroxyacid dehydrogenase [Paenibacillus segetis]|uniref:Bifunctional glyoxylate/hydroxypyruvate reductase B n=1 Tax=Paenibacillus segetis TaxID=1325360 RepID=A0ABQ1Y6V0_9BACL|nr:D-glycerate dehydrogenase [Paenibacillus segetis]GGH13544.1 bifunctional glyoxylate/hydroxypyruvate reductase B [Paenibacillus segetis]